MISNIRNKKIVLISPHPDDIEIGMGGTAYLLAKKKINFTILLLQMEQILQIYSKIKRNWLKLGKKKP